MISELWQLDQVSLGPLSRPRLSNVTLSIRPGVTAVIGASGAGKTSLLNLLVQFERPRSGRLTFHRSRASSELAWVPVDGGLWPQLTVREHIAAVMGQNANERRSVLNAQPSSVSDWIDAFDLSALSERHPETLSMGERSRLSVARALSSGAAVQVMDEPLAHVDPARLPSYWKIIHNAIRDSGTSLVFATHVPETVLREADRVICLSQGKILWEGDCWQLYHHPPTKELAEFFGPVNWFEQQEALRWLSNSNHSEGSLRPERLLLQPSADSSLEIEGVRFVGSCAETDVLDIRTQQRRTFYHRPAGPSLQRGQRVAIQVLTFCLLLCLGLAISGCREGAGQDHLLTFRNVEHANLPSEGAMLPAPRGLTFGPQGELYVLDKAGRMLVYDPAGKLIRQWWMPEYSAGKPEGAWVLKDGRVAVADTHYHRVLFFDLQGNPAGSWGSQGAGQGQFIYTVAITQDPDGFVYVAEYGGNDRVQKFTPSGDYVLSIGRPGTNPGEFQRASGVAWKDGIVYVADAINNRVHAFRDDGTFVRIIADAESAGLHYPYDLALAPDGTLWLAEYGANRITQISTAGELLGHWGSAGRGLDQLWTPWGIAVSPSGEVIVADTGNRRLVELQR